MNITLTKHIFGDAEIADSNFIGCYSPKIISRAGLLDEEIANIIRNPIETKPLSQMGKGCRNVLIVTDDNTRPTPLERLIRPVLSELEIAGVTTEQITFLIGLGTHREMTKEEIVSKFGADIADKYKIINHRWDDPDSLVSLGKCELGFEVVINKLVCHADLIISIGSIVPHATTGYSGGCKTIITGIAGEKTIENTHWMSLNYPMNEILGAFDNPVRKAISNLSRKINLGMIINTILFDDDSKVYGLVAGEPEAAHAEGARVCSEVYSVTVPQKGEVVVAEAYPSDIDLRQAIKAICAANLVCKDGGVIILPAECPEGTSPQFPDFVKYGFKNPEKLYKDVNAGKFDQKLMAYTLVAIGQIISKRVRAILVSPNIDLRTAEQMGFVYAPNLQNAIDKAFSLTEDNAKALVLKQASVLLPHLGQNAQ